MKRTTDESALMIRYLLGDVSEEEQLRLEEQFFGNDESYQLLTALESELRYDYAQGNLSARDRSLFEKRFLVTPADRQKVQLAKAVLEKSWEAARLQVAAEPKPSAWKSLVRFFSIPSVSVPSAAGATAALAAVFFFMQNQNLKQQLNQSQQAVQVAQKSANEAVQKRTQEPAPAVTAPQKAAEPFVVAFALAPGLTRDVQGPKSLRIPANADQVRLQLDLKPSDRAPEMRASLQNLDGQELWSQDTRSLGTSVVLNLPVRLLPPGDYVVELKAKSAPADAPRGSEYYFTVVR